MRTKNALKISYSLYDNRVPNNKTIILDKIYCMTKIVVYRETLQECMLDKYMEDQKMLQSLYLIQ